MDFIEVFDCALPSAFCEELLQTFESHPGVHDGRTGGGVDPEKKLSRDLTLDAHRDLHEQLGRIQPYTLTHLALYFRRYPFALIGSLSPTLREPRTGQPLLVDIGAFETITDSQLLTLIKTIYRSGIVNMQRYDTNVGGYPHWHSEIYPEDTRCDPLHRVLFYMYYLNDVTEGGETEFYFQSSASCRVKAGWSSLQPASLTPIAATCRARPQNIITSWLQFRRSEELFRDRSKR